MREYRNTPRADGISPAMLFVGRTQRTMLPRLPGAYDQVAATPRPERPAGKNKEFELPSLEPGSRVRIQHVKTGRWDQIGTIVKVHGTGRSYFVDVDGDAVVWRNRRFLKPLPL